MIWLNPIRKTTIDKDSKPKTNSFLFIYFLLFMVYMVINESRRPR